MAAFSVPPDVTLLSSRAEPAAAEAEVGQPTASPSGWGTTGERPVLGGGRGLALYMRFEAIHT